MTHALKEVWFAVVLVALAVLPASAQSPGEPNPWSHGTTLNLFAGASRADADTQPVFGASMGWEVTPSIAVEGSGYWFDHGTERDAFAAALKLDAGLPVRRPVVPFVSAGIGLYRASFNGASTVIPAFYRDRIIASGRSTGAVNVFTDPSFIVGAGVHLFASRHVSIRPDVEMTFVRGDSHTHMVTIGAVHFAYHFEKHPLTR